jgi:hypothetical protein
MLARVFGTKPAWRGPGCRTALDKGQRSPRKLLRKVVARLLEILNSAGR